MAFRTQNASDLPVIQFQRAVQVASQIKRETVIIRDAALAGAVNVANLFTGLLATLVRARPELEKARSTPGIAAYAKNQLNDPAYNVGVEFTAMMDEIVTTTAWFETNFPQDAHGHLEMWKFVGDGSGAVNQDVLTNLGQLNALVTRLNALIASID